MSRSKCVTFFFFNDTATTEIYTLSLHDALPIFATQDDPAHAAKLGCKDCHGAPGVYSFNSYVPFRLAGPGFTQAPRLSEISLVDAEQVAVAWKQQRVDWGRLQPLLRGPLKLRDH